MPIDLKYKTPAELKKVICLQKNWSAGDLLDMLDTMKTNTYIKDNDPVSLGDAFLLPHMGHPAIIIKIEGDMCYCLTLTTDDNYPGIIVKLGSEFFKNSHVTCNLSVVNSEFIKRRFYRVITKQRCELIFKMYKEYVNKL